MSRKISISLEWGNNRSFAHWRATTKLWNVDLTSLTLQMNCIEETYIFGVQLQICSLKHYQIGSTQHSSDILREHCGCLACQIFFFESFLSLEGQQKARTAFVSLLCSQDALIIVRENKVSENLFLKARSLQYRERPPALRTSDSVPFARILSSICQITKLAFSAQSFQCWLHSGDNNGLFVLIAQESSV